MKRSARRAAAVAAAALCLACSYGAVAEAATIEVTSTAESGPGSLGSAIVLAEVGDTIELGPGEFVLTNGEFLVAKGLTIRGAGEERTTIVPSGGGEALDDPNVTVVEATISAPRQPDGAGEDADGPEIETKAQIIALVGTIAFFLFILELVRRRRLVERYALLWMLVAVALLILSIWTSGLGVIAEAMGIEEPANAIFILAFGAAFLLLLNFSVATSRLSEETKILAQEAARLELELRIERGEASRGESPPEGREGSGAPGAEEPHDDRPVAAKDPR